MSALVDNSLVKMAGGDGTFSLVWLERMQIPANPALSWVIGMDGFGLTVPRDKLRPLLPSVEGKESPYDKEVIGAAVMTLTDIAAKKAALEIDNEALRDQLNKATVDNAKIRAENQLLVDHRIKISVPSVRNAKWVYIQEDGQFVRYARTDQVMAPDSPPPEAEKKPEIDWSKDVYCKFAKSQPYDSLWRLSPPGLCFLSEKTYEGQQRWVSSGVPYNTMRLAIESGEYVVIPNPWPEPTQKPTVEEAGDALAEAIAGAFGLLSTEAAGSPLVKRKFNAIYQAHSAYKAARGK